MSTNQLPVGSGRQTHGSLEPDADITIDLRPVFVDGPRREPVRASRPVVLVVEDDDDTRDLMSGALERDGIDVLRAADRASAFAILRSWQVDAVTLDIGLPDGDGLDLCETIRHQRFRRSIPVVAVTARSSFDAELRCFLSGVDDYIVKPVSPTGLVRQVRRLLDGQS
ncbi:response regulator [Kineosporia sp. R_H_3]|uniref:response regulator n=1 Tax=Kineosporia sp. R_H_3 TaxID=1961848 RepID=UPI00117A7DB5|nr:response regulator [Kineosporia sp. R_H_3]